ALSSSMTSATGEAAGGASARAALPLAHSAMIRTATVANQVPRRIGDAPPWLADRLRRACSGSHLRARPRFRRERPVTKSFRAAVPQLTITMPCVNSGPDAARLSQAQLRKDEHHADES